VTGKLDRLKGELDIKKFGVRSGAAPPPGRALPPKRELLRKAAAAPRRIARRVLTSSSLETIRFTRETDSFQQGEAVHISFEVRNVPRGSKIRVVWSDAARRVIAEEEKPLPSNGAVSFEMKDAGSLAEGEYMVEFFRADPSAARGWGFLGTKPFKVGPKARCGNCDSVPRCSRRRR
jgi:hypothetical protein